MCARNCLDAGDIVMNKAEQNKNSWPGVCVIVEEEESEQINYIVCQKVVNALEGDKDGYYQWLLLVVRF